MTPRRHRARIRVRLQLLRVQDRAGLGALTYEQFLELRAYEVRRLFRKVDS